MKGTFQNECNRTACKNQNAVFYNHSTKMYYCGECAELINKSNYADAMRMYGHDLCTLVGKYKSDLNLFIGLDEGLIKVDEKEERERLKKLSENDIMPG